MASALHPALSLSLGLQDSQPDAKLGLQSRPQPFIFSDRPHHLAPQEAAFPSHGARWLLQPLEPFGS